MGLVTGSICWTFYIPYRPYRLYAVIPADAIWVGRHKQLAQRWYPALQNPLIKHLLHTMGIKTAPLLKTGQKAETVQRLVTQLASKDTVFAYVPWSGIYGRPAWVFSSWVGSREYYLRLLLSLNLIKACIKVDIYHGRTIWKWDMSPQTDNRTVYFTISEGVWWGCVADGLNTFRYLLDKMDGRGASFFEDRSAGLRASIAGAHDARDEGWVDLSDRSPYGLLYYRIDRFTERHIDATLRIDMDAPDHDESPNATLDGLRRILGDAPFLVLAVNTPLLVSVLKNRIGEPWLDVAGQLSELGETGHTVVAILDGAYGGQFKGIKIPGVVIGVKMPKDFDAYSDVNRLLDRLNATYQWGLIPHRTMIENQTAFMLEGTADTAYAGFGDKEQWVYTLWDDWFLLARGIEPLRTLMKRNRQEDGTSRSSYVEHYPRLDGGAFADAYGWLDLKRTTQAVRRPANLYSLKLYFKNSDESAGRLKTVKRATAWLDELALFEACHLVLARDDEGTSLRVLLGEIEK